MDENETGGEILKLPNLSRLSLSALMFLFNREAREDANEGDKIRQFTALANKYFSGRLTYEKFNLYQILRNSMETGVMRSQKLAMQASAIILSTELQPGVSETLPKSHLDAFFYILTNFIEVMNKNMEEQKAEFQITWDFGGSQGLIRLLSILDGPELKTPLLKKKVNALIREIQETETKKAELATANTDGNAPAKQTDAMAAIMDVKALKIPKSKMTKQQVQDVLKNFALLDEKERHDFVKLAMKKWDDAITSLPAAHHFMYFRDNPMPSQKANYFKSLIKSLEDTRTAYLMWSKETRSEEDSLKKLLTLWGYADFQSLVDDMAKRYMDTKGSTHIGREHYIASMHAAVWPSNDHKSTSEHAKWVRGYLYANALLPAVDALEPMTGWGIDAFAHEWVKPDAHPIYWQADPFSVKWPSYKSDKYTDTANDTFVMDEKYVNIMYSFTADEKETPAPKYLSDMIALIKTYFCAYDGDRVAHAKKTPKFHDPEYVEPIMNILSVLDSIRINGDSLIRFDERTQTERAKQTYDRDGMSHFVIRNWFCSDKVTPEAAWDILKDNRSYQTLLNITKSGNHSNYGSYHGPDDYLYELLALCMDKFDFGKKEDRELFFSYEIYSAGFLSKKTAHGKPDVPETNIFEKTMSKMESECPEVMPYVRGCFKPGTEPRVIVKFIAEYFKSEQP